jgi:hypothetical protein
VLIIFSHNPSLESKTCRDWISGAIINRTAMSNASAPSSYSSSFNIFPALTIGITGLAMSAHHQEYAFSVSIHALWGNLLAGFAICRILTYTFLHLRPPASILPSRPPTEALAAFCLCAGGIVFMLSTEEVIFWAMRHGFDDMMTFLNATVAFVCACLAWILVLMALKGKRVQNIHSISCSFADQYSTRLGNKKDSTTSRGSWYCRRNPDQPQVGRNGLRAFLFGFPDFRVSCSCTVPRMVHTIPRILTTLFSNHSTEIAIPA